MIQFKHAMLAQERVSEFLRDQHARGRINDYFGNEFFHLRHESICAAIDLVKSMVPEMTQWMPTLIGASTVSAVCAAIGSPIHALAFDEISMADGWQSLGMPTFDVTAGLMANLLLTDCGRVDELDVPIPFRSFRITLPSPDCPIYYVGTSGTVDRIRSVSVYCWRAGFPAGSTQLDMSVDHHALAKAYRSIAMSSTLPEMAFNIRRHLGMAEAQYHALQPGNTIVIRAYGGDGTSIFSHQPWGDGTVGDWMDAVDDADHDGPLAATHALVDVDRAAIRALQRLVVNLCLYLNSSNEHTKKLEWTPKDRTIGKRGKTWRVGAAVKVDKEVREAAAQIAAGVRRDSPLVRHIVRGHFKQQAHGQGRAERRRIYVSPYWRGPIDGPNPPRKYEVK